jgi:SNF2 family DNA or RNA helicase
MPVRLRTDLHNYQDRAVQFIKSTERCALFLDLGLGKSAITLTAVSDLQDQMEIHKALVIAPLRVANSVWDHEVKLWKHLRHLKVQVCTGTERERLTALHRDADIYTINRENVPWLVKQYGKKWPFDCVIIDESSSFKNATSLRFKALKKILPFTNYMVLLTGTPVPNGLLDIWSQIYLLDGGTALGRTMTAYKQRFFEADYMGYKYTPRVGADVLIHSAIASKVLSMKGSDYLELPDRINLNEYVDLPIGVMQTYKDFERELLLELDTGEVVEAITAAVLANKLLQYSSGAVYTDEHKNWKEIHTVKLDALADLIEQNEGECILIAYNFKTDLERLQQRFPKAQVLDKNPNTIVRWNNGEIPILLAHPASSGHGINLQHGGTILVWFCLNWSLEYYQQFNGRLHRQGQTKPVRIVHIVARDTIDERIISALAAKDVTQSDLLKALKHKEL